jgi:5-formyltetrahydrofolate cyclo-ligase
LKGVAGLRGSHYSGADLRRGGKHADPASENEPIAFSVPDPHPTDDPVLLRKAEMRAAALALRDGLDADARTRAAETAAQRGLPVAVADGMIVSGFMPIRSEISPLPLLRRLAEAGARLALPAIAGRGRPLAMRRWSFGAPLQRGQWGIREPGPEAEAVIPDLLIVPLAAFDRRGGRIGYGAGYYDMTIAQARAAKPACAIGLAFAAQEVEEVPMLSHDQRLDFVLTERETISCRGS